MSLKGAGQRALRRLFHYLTNDIIFTNTLGWHGGETEMAVKWNAVKVFSATKSKEREELGSNITRWIAANPGVEVIDFVVRQSSDNEYHCLTIIVFYNL